MVTSYRPFQDESAAMDENTKMMIQLASMMMQNENAIKETQSQLESMPASKTPPLKTSTDNSTSNGTPITQSGVPTTANPAFGMDPKLMAEFARQIVMNANNKTAIDFSKKSAKPTTIAQIMQQQDSHTSTANASSEGKIFVYNKIPDVDENSSPAISAAIKTELDSMSLQTPVSLTNGNGMYHVTTPSTNKRGGSSVGPIRNRYGRVLRPGIDNFGQFEAVTNHGLIMHAMELLRQKDKKKRGPKEKDTFSVFMYCLPDKNSKLPKFSSLDPVERALVEQHQLEGYGYPSMDYINGIPRKTQLCLSFDEAQFHAYMVTLYPKMEGRLYDMYRIDKTRRLIRVEAKSPRQLKDMKYQGSLIVIPYESPDDRPSAVIHRNFDDVYSGSPSLGNPLSLMANFNIPLPMLPDAASPTETRVKSEPSQGLASLFPGRSATPTTSDSETNGTTNGDKISDRRENGHTNAFDDVKLLKRALQARESLKSAKKIQVRADSIFSDVINAYREDERLECHRVDVCFYDDSSSQDPQDIPFGSLLVMFWEQAFRKHFTGNHHLVPVLDPYSGEDLFQIFGRMLVHGLVLENYVPLQLSPACFSFVLANSCSDQLSLSSFYQVMSKTEREVLLAALAEAKLRLDSFSPRVDRSIRTVLGSYGCKDLPQMYELESHVPNIAKSFLLYQPYWALCQIQEVFCQSELDLSGISEEDIMHVYKVLSPDVPSLLQKVVFVYSGSDENKESENRVKNMFEEYLHKLTNAALLKLVRNWCGLDCLCVSSLQVKFIGDEKANAAFEPQIQNLNLPSAVVSMDELSQYISSSMRSRRRSEESMDTYEYTI